MPIEIVYDGHKIVGDLFIHNNEFRNYVNYTYILVLYNVKQFKMIYRGFEWQDMERLAKCQPMSEYADLPKTDTNKNFPLNIPKFQGMYSFHYHVDNEYHRPSKVGEICLQIEINEDIDVQIGDKFKSLISNDVISKFEGEKNFTIRCNGESFQFNKTLLSMMSEIFKQMFYGNSKEAQSNCVEINDFNPKTIEAFGRVAFGDENIKNEDLTTDLLMFANKYFMKPLMEKCRNNLVQILNNDNLGEIIKVAYHIDDEELLKICAKYLLEHKKELNSTQHWKNFVKSNKECMKQVCLFLALDD